MLVCVTGVGLLVFYLVGSRVNTVTLEGVVTTVFTDCDTEKTLAPDGHVRILSAESCDGGSYITLDNETVIATASGYVAENAAFDMHDSSWQPGQKAEAKVIKSGNGYTLNCTSCTIKIK
jgi:hypothetical protein